MASSQKVVPSSPNSSSISSISGQYERNGDGIVLNSFKLKPAGSGPTRITLVENDSLSSYSLPEETNHHKGTKGQSGERANNGAFRDSSDKRKGVTSSFAPRGHIVLEIENSQHTGPLEKPTHVESYLKFMYWTCVSPYNPNGRLSFNGKSTASESILSVIQKLLFLTMIGFSFIKSFFQVKFFVLIYMEFSDLEAFIDMMLYIMNAGTKLYYVYLFVTLKKRFSVMLLKIDKLRDFRMPNANSDGSKNYSTMKYAIMLGISSIIMSLIQTAWLVGVREWTPSKGMLFHSFTTAIGLFAWSKENVGNGTWLDSIEEEYNYKTNLTNILLGAFGLIINFCSCLHNEATGDLMQMLAEALKEEMQCLQNKIDKTENDEQNTTLVGFFRENGEWEHSRLLTQATDSCNNAFDPIMKFKHVNNLMLYVFFVLNLFDGDHSLAYLAYLLYDICKSSYTYRIAVEASTLNDSKRDWIRRLAWKSNDNEFHKRVPLLLGEIKEKPIGMGKGQFMINESFIYRFLGWVGSLFVLQSQSREAAKPE